MPDLDLTRGITQSDRPGSRPIGQQASATAETRAKKAEEGLKGELEGIFGRIAEALAAREDEELSEAFEQDKRILSNGLVNLTATLTPLRKPLVLGIKLVEPVLAFGRIATILAGRFRRRFIYDSEDQAGVQSQ